MGVICSSGLAGDFWNSWSMMKFKWSQKPKLTVETFLIFNLLPPELVEKGWGQMEGKNDIPELFRDVSVRVSTEQKEKKLIS